MKLNKENILALNPCSDGLMFAELCDFDAVKIWNACPRGDWIIWLLRKTRLIDRQTSVKLGCLCAEHVLSIYESKYQDKRPRLAIESAKVWSDNPTHSNLVLVRQAAGEAWEARRFSYSAARADAAAYAAASAYAATDSVVTDSAAAYAADAVYAAAAVGVADGVYAADAAAACAAECKWQADSIRRLVPCPFTIIT
jgi:hypothetical protein